MTQNLFAEYLEKQFLPHLAEKGGGPAILVFDGHMSHIRPRFVELADKNHVTLFKLPAKTTDVLQPLDVACFAPLKARYQQFAQRQLAASSGTNFIGNQTFATTLCEVWCDGEDGTEDQSKFVAEPEYEVTVEDTQSDPGDLDETGTSGAPARPAQPQEAQPVETCRLWSLPLRRHLSAD